MDQAAAAARALQPETEYLVARALETAIAVCYMRPFTRSAMTLPDSFVPTTEPDARYHAEFKTLRDKVYAHTDKASGRSASMNVETVTNGIVNLAYRDAWYPIERQALPTSIAFFERQAHLFRQEAAHIRVKIAPYGHVSGTEGEGEKSSR